MITLENGEKLAYDDLIIATGTGGPFPAKLPLDVNKEKAVQRYEDYVKFVSVFNLQTICTAHGLSHLQILNALFNNEIPTGLH